jgi:DNA-binding NarL/FixJ family response regulator
MTRVFVVSNVRLYREGLEEMLVRDGRLQVAGADAEAPRDQQRLVDTAADVVLLDMGIPEALEAIRRLARGPAHAKVVALGVANRSQRVVACAEAGVANYIGRDSSLDDLVRAVEGAVRGEFACPPRVAAALVGRVARLAERQAADVDEELYLTPRQLEVARLLDRGLTNQEIAGRLSIEVSTVKIHVHNIMDKLGVHRRGQAVAKLHRTGLLSRGQSTGIGATG